MYNYLFLFKTRRKVAGRVVVVLLIAAFLGTILLLQIQEMRRQRRTEEIYAVLGSRNTVESVKPDEDTVLIDSLAGYVSPKVLEHRSGASATEMNYPRSPSRPLNKDQPVPYALIMIMSHVAPETDLRRRIIRQTWGGWAASRNIRFAFFIGIPSQGNFSMRSISQEAQLYGDIVLDDIQDSYLSLPIKVMRMLKWFNRTFPDEQKRPSYLIKADHDVFIHIPNLIRHLKTVEGNKKYIGGVVHVEGPVVRDGGDKWYVPRDLWDQESFPAYVAGPAYILASSIVPQLYETALKEKLIHLEDVLITGIVACQRLGLELDPIPTRIMPQLYPRGEFDRKEVICVHPMDPEQMIRFYLSVPEFLGQ